METKKDKQYVSVISVIIITCIFVLIVAIVLFNVFKTKVNTYDVRGKTFKLYDNATITFSKDKDDLSYIFKYNVLDQDVVMKGKYRLTYGDNIDKNIRYEYEKYVENNEEYMLGFIELQNEELYINGSKAENGYINTYYIARTYLDNNLLKFIAYNTDTGEKVEFNEIR